MMKLALEFGLRIALIAVIPLWIWCVYLDVPRQVRWQSPGYAWAALALSISIGLSGVMLSMRKYSWRHRLLAGMTYTICAGVFLLLIGFAAAVANV